LEAQDLVNIRAVPPAVFDFLRPCVQARLNFLVSGRYRAREKTTFLNVLLVLFFCRKPNASSPSKTRPSFRLNQPHIVRLNRGPPTSKALARIRIRDLFRNSLRMRPGPHHHR